MAATPKNYDVTTMHQGPGNLWIIGNPPSDDPDTGTRLTLFGDGTPDATAHPGCIHLGATESGSMVIAAPKIEQQKADEFEGALDAILAEADYSLEATLEQAQDLSIMEQVLLQAGYTVQPAIAGGAAAAKQLVFGGLNKQIGPVVFTGIGLDDAVSGGVYSGTRNAVIDVVIDGAGAPDTFKWRINGGAYTLGVAITGAAQALTLGITIKFAATTGHTLADAWQIQVRLAQPCVALIAPTKANAAKYIVYVLYKVYSIGAASLIASRAKPMHNKITFHGLQDPARTAGRQTGVVYVTL